MNRVWLALCAVPLVLVSNPAQADIVFCNKTYKTVSLAFAAVSEYKDTSVTGWFEMPSGECSTVLSGPASSSTWSYYFYAKRADNLVWEGQDQESAFCIPDDVSKPFVELLNQRPPPPGSVPISSAPFQLPKFHVPDCSPSGKDHEAKFRYIDASGQQSITRVFRFKDEPEITSGQLNSRCLASWDDSQQMHSLSISFQRTTVRMKKLHHCIRLSLNGPIDIAGIGRDYVKKCVDYGINHRKTEYILKELVALALDVEGGSGSFSVGVVTDYANSVANGTLDCLTNMDELNDYLKAKLRSDFHATVQNESHWEYWNL